MLADWFGTEISFLFVKGEETTRDTCHRTAHPLFSCKAPGTFTASLQHCLHGSFTLSLFLTHVFVDIFSRQSLFCAGTSA
jgi:hypothetical protein